MNFCRAGVARFSLILVLMSSLFIGADALAQGRTKRVPELDSVDCANKAAVLTFIKRSKLELLTSLERDRLGEDGTFKPMCFTFNVFFPFEIQLGRLYRPYDEGKIKLNVAAFVHSSIEGNYGIGLGPRLSFLTFKHCYLSYQIALGWFDVNNPTAKDGLTNRSVNFNHQLALNYSLGKHWTVGIQVIHTSNGDLFAAKGNVQDGVGVGVGYQFGK